MSRVTSPDACLPGGADLEVAPYAGYEVQHELNSAGRQRQVAAGDGLQSDQLDGAGAHHQLAAARVEEPQQVHLWVIRAEGQLLPGRRK